MELNLETAFEQPVDLSHLFEVPVERLSRPELVSLEPVALRGRLEKADKGFHLAGELNIAAVVACARCLKDVPFSRTAPVSWTLAPVHERPNAEELELEAGDLDVVFYEDLVLPLDPLIDEQLQLELPMKPLCSETCRGLCPQCGVDLNIGSCSCETPGDDRWTALRSLKS